MEVSAQERHIAGAVLYLQLNKIIRSFAVLFAIHRTPLSQHRSLPISVSKGHRRVLWVFPASFILFILPAALPAAESLDERLSAELRLINQFSSQLVSANEEFIEELNRETCLKTSPQGDAQTSPTCKEQTLRHLNTLDENNAKTEEYVIKMVEGWARIYGMLRVAHMQCGLNSIDFEMVPATMELQSRLIQQDPDYLILKYIEASESADRPQDPGRQSAPGPIP
ncbi:MAG: hypothetical protein ACPHQ9_16000 [Marinobacter sp.]|uniref:hypothetical protein n=1 Tax=Marinobacter sp. TaxID=50741 RepID=UPI003C672749